jgi:hypothetical protein
MTRPAESATRHPEIVTAGHAGWPQEEQHHQHVLSVSTLNRTGSPTL